MIPLHKPYIDDDELSEIKEVLDSGWLTQGSKVEKFENEMKKLTGINHVIACSSCTTALHLALLSVGIKKGDVVLVADYTFPSTGHAVMYCGATPIFVDIDQKTYNMDSKDLERKIKKYESKVKAVIPVHTFGQCADMDPIISVAKKYNCYVIEDAACAVGSKYKGRSAGSLGDIGCFSFHAAKGITCGEGGVVTTNNDEIADRVRCLRNIGIEDMSSPWKRNLSNKFMLPNFEMIGYNYRMTDISAAIGISQFRKLDKVLSRKQELAKYWDNELKVLSDFITPPFISTDTFHNFQGYTTLVSDNIDRDSLIQTLKNKGVGTQIGTYASHLLDVYNCDYSCHVSRDVYNRAFRLPMYYGLTEDMIDKVINDLKEVLSEMK